MKRELARFPIGEVIALICVIALIWAFQQMQWIADGRDTGWQILSDAPPIAESGLSSIWLIPMTIAVAGVATIVGLVREQDRKTTRIIIALAALIGLIYFAVFAAYNTITLPFGAASEEEAVGFKLTGFWVALLAITGLVLQVFIPRTETQVSIFDVDWWGLLPFEVNLKHREAIVAYIFLAPFLTFFGIFVVKAVFEAVRMSFYNWLILPPTEEYMGLANYRELFNDDVWWQALRNTFIFATLTVIGTTIVSLFAALAVTRPIRGQEFFRVLLYMPQLLSVGAVGLIWVWLLNTQFGVFNYALSSVGLPTVNWLGNPSMVIPSLSLTTIWWTFGFPMLIFIAGLQAIPEQLYEAARIDGASPIQIFFRITLPLLRPTILFVTVTGVIGHFQVYGQPFIMTTGGPGRSSYTVIFYLYQMAWVAFRMGYGAAVAVTIALIMGTMTVLQFVFIGRRVEY
jgi:multiple sugar transport system permease protein